MDVLVASIAKRLPDKIIEDAIRFQKQYKCVEWFIEAVQFQEFLRTEIIKRAHQQNVPMPCRPIIPNTDKALRIQSLQPAIEDGLIRIHKDQITLIQQLQQWPNADHDDGPDFLHMLYHNAIQRAGVALTADTIKTAPRENGGLTERANRFSIVEDEE